LHQQAAIIGEDKMKIRKLLVLMSICVAGLFSVTANAQTPPLVEFVQMQPNSTPLHEAVATAVNKICPALAAEGGVNLPAAERDLFLRCNELINTALDSLGRPFNRSLEISDAELLASQQEIWGEEAHANGTVTTRLTNGQFSNIAGRMNALRLGAASGAVGGRVASVAPDSDIDRASPGYSLVSLDSRRLTGGAAAGDVAGSRWGWFLEGSFNTGDHDETANENPFEFDSTSFSLGLDYLFDWGVIGIAVGQDNFEAEFDQATFVSGGDVEVEGTSGSLFGAWFGEGFYVDGLVTWGSLDNDLSRMLVYPSEDMCDPACPPQDRMLTGETDGDFLSIGASVGYEAVRGNWDITTSLSVAYRDIDIDGFDEVDTSGGGMNLRYADQTIESLRTILGVAFTGNFSRGFGVLSPHFRAEWHHEFEDDPIFIDAKYVGEDILGTPTGDFTSTSCFSCTRFGSDPVDTDFGLVGVGLSAVFSRRVQLYFMYDALIGIDNLSSHTFSVGLRGQF
jgi:uncharacterized protein YhjY with autotransporter beta-barrel domain